MDGVLEYLAVLFIVTNLVLLASSRIGLCIKAVAAQGMILGLVPLLRHADHLRLSSVVIGLVTMLLKGVLFPKLLAGAANRAGVRREVEPFVSYSASLLFGVGMLLFAFWLQTRLPTRAGTSDLLLPASFFAILCGFFVSVSRRKALTQVLGYLALENGIYAFGAATLAEHPWLFELGILLDVLAAVFVMGIAIFHISREFEHIDVDRLSSLRDAGEEGKA